MKLKEWIDTLQMFAELQMLTPMVPTREVYFLRHCKRLSPERWAIVDVSIDRVEDNMDSSLIKCRKRPSGCIIEDKVNGHCKVYIMQFPLFEINSYELCHDITSFGSQVTWVEHMESQKSTIHPMYRALVNGGLAFGAGHWMATLQLQCERNVFFMATNIPTKDSTGKIRRT